MQSAFQSAQSLTSSRDLAIVPGSAGEASLLLSTECMSSRLSGRRQFVPRQSGRSEADQSSGGRQLGCQANGAALDLSG